jgi:hypothetical protein
MSCLLPTIWPLPGLHRRPLHDQQVRARQREITGHSQQLLLGEQRVQQFAVHSF